MKTTPSARQHWTGIGLALGWVLLGGLTPTVRAQSYLRIVTYNVNADTNGNTTAGNGLATVLAAIGEQTVGGVQRPLDVLALEETTSNTATVQPIVDALNSYYGAGTYACDAYQGTQAGGPASGNGPNALVYNTHTVQVVLQNGAEAAGVPGTPSSSAGVYRQVVRYALHAVGAAANLNFYLYVSHMKSSASGTTATVQGYRNNEAKLIRADAATLPAGTSVLYLGDFNLDGSAEPAYQTLTASSTSVGQGIDPLNTAPQNNAEDWSKAAYKNLMTESATGIGYRDDIQFMTADVYNGTAAAALRYVPGSAHAFGNNGSIAIGSSVDQAKNTALDNLSGPITAAQAKTALTTATDHLPMVADYVVATPYNTWQLGRFTPAELANAAVSGDAADPDGDGIVNLLEYALGLDPKQTNATGLPTVGQTTVSGQNYLTLTYTKVVAATDITYLSQVSGDLATWNGGAGSTVVVNSVNNADGTTQTVTVRDAMAAGAANRRFLRLLVSRP